MSSDRRIELVEVGPRDGLQSQPTLLDTATKVEFVTRLAEAGLRRIEVASFVDPRRVPQMADVEALIAALPRREGVRYIGLVLNRRGFERARDTAIDEVNCVLAMSDSFGQRNQGRNLADGLEGLRDIAAVARGSGLVLGVSLAVAFGCPFEGEVPLGRLVEVAARLADLGFAEIALADTIGVAGPSDVLERVAAVREAVGALPLRCHFHDTRNTGVANAWAAVQAGVGVLDASCGGVGGCPFAPAATGNVATEDLLYMLQRTGAETGVDLERLIDTGHWLAERLGTPLPSRVGRAGPFRPLGAQRAERG